MIDYDVYDRFLALTHYTIIQLKFDLTDFRFREPADRASKKLVLFVNNNFYLKSADWHV